MRRWLLVLALVFVPAFAHADPIIITSGSAGGSASNPGQIDLAGDNFSLTGRITPLVFGSVTPALGCCFAPESTLALTAEWFIGSLLNPVSVVVDGQTFTKGPGPTDVFGGVLTFSTTMMLPALLGDTATVSAPFRFAGSFNKSYPDGPLIHVDLVGSGIGTLFLRNPVGLNAWDARSVQFEFVNPIPEPSTLVLFGTGLAAAYRLRRRRSPHP